MKVMNSSWDYLVVLDACRYDYFEKINTIPGKLSKHISEGSSTSEWLNKNFEGYYSNCCYISANPNCNSSVAIKGFNGGDHFPQVLNLWLSAWDDNRKTVMPDMTTKMAIEFIKENKYKRYIIHYLQPHQPYIGPSAPDYNCRMELEPGMEIGRNKKKIKHLLIDNLLPGVSKLYVKTAMRFYRTIMHQKPLYPVDVVLKQQGRSGVIDGYAENLNCVLTHIVDLIHHLKGKVVITSDHGELLGEYGVYGHTPNSNLKILRQVPWLEVER